MLTRRGLAKGVALLGATPHTALAQTPPDEDSKRAPDEKPTGKFEVKPEAPSGEQKSEPPRPIVVLLSVDGGGIRGIAAAAMLREIDSEFQANGLRLIDCVDVFAGTSTGSIIAAGMAASKDRTLPYWEPQAIIDIYRQQGPTIFGRRQSSSLLDLSRQRWDSRGLDQVLGTTFGGRRLRDLPGNLIVPYYNMEAPNGKSAVVALGGGLCDPAESRSQHYVRDVVSASSSAPTYFNPHRLNDTTLGVDGGVFANNPAMTAWVATQKWIQDQERYSQADIYVISIGCGARAVQYPRNTTWGPLEWLQFWGQGGPPIIDVLMRGQSDLVDAQMAELMSPGKNYFRFQFDLPAPATRRETPVGGLDDVSIGNLNALEHLGVESCRTVQARTSIQSMVGIIKRVRRQLEVGPERAIPNARV